MPRQTSVRTQATGNGLHRGWYDDWKARQLFLDARDKAGDPGVEPAVFALPVIPGLVEGSRRIDEADEQELRWFFGDPRVASLTRSSGAFGNQLEIASAYGYGSLPCRRCGGRYRTRRRISNNSVGEEVAVTEATIDWRDGTGWAPRDHFGARVSYAKALEKYRSTMQREHRIVLGSKPTPRADSAFTSEQLWLASVEAFRAQGKQLMTDRAFRATFDRLPEELCQPCRMCQGLGVIPRKGAAHVEITAYPTGSSKGGATARRKDPGKAVEEMSASGVVSDGFGVVAMGELARYREAHELLADVAALSPIAAVSLEEYYSARPGQNAERNGQVALERMVGELFGLEGAACVRAASKLRDHQCGVYQVAAYGVS